jgi:beta-lactamase regulating signal transducer with metallopeptidase domain
MIQLLEHFLNWVAIETLLTGLLFVSYHALIKRLSNPVDRFNFLCLSFLMILFIPWAPVPLLSEPFASNFIMNVVLALQNQIRSYSESWIAQVLLVLIPGIPVLAYSLVLFIRGFRLLNGLLKVNQISETGTLTRIQTNYPVIQHDYSLAPMIVGITKPKILISEEILRTVSKSELALIIQHEEEHIHRFDNLSNLLRLFVREILFFSPFIWNLSQKFEDEMELSVDAAVLTQNKNSERIYGNLLLKVTDSQFTRETCPIGPFLSNSSLKKRILSLKKAPKNRAKILSSLALGTFVMIGMLGASLFGPQAYSASKPSRTGNENYVQR